MPSGNAPSASFTRVTSATCGSPDYRSISCVTLSHYASFRSRPVSGVDHARHVEIEVRCRPLAEHRCSRFRAPAERLIGPTKAGDGGCECGTQGGHRVYCCGCGHIDVRAERGSGAGVIRQDEITEVMRFRNYSKVDLILWLIRIHLTDETN
jgi:hypothetical protein